MQLKPNTLLQGGKYKIIRALGQGGFGITYEAEQVLLRRKVAVKEFFMKDCCERDDATSRVTVGTGSQRALVEKFRGKFIREAQMIAGMEHPHIIRVTDVFEENDTAYYVMDYLPGGSLVDQVKRNGPLSEDKAEKYIRQVAGALNYIHSQNTVHLDVKPSNILLNAKGEAILIDFGISKHYDDSGDQTSSTPVGISKGFAPLEQGRDGDVSQFKPSTDIYALGATLYYLISGIVPPEASIVNEDGLTKPQGVSDRIWAVIDSAMQPRRKDRPQNIDGFLADLNGNSEAGHLEDDEEKTVIIAKEENVFPKDPSVKSKFNRTWLWALVAGLGIIVVLGTLLKRPPKPSEPTAVSDSTSISTAVNPDTISNNNNIPASGNNLGSTISPKIKFKQKRYELTTSVGHKFKLNYSSESNNPVKWTSSNTSVLTVNSNGIITVRGAGTATITASVENEHDSCICVIRIQPEEDDSSVTTTPNNETTSTSNLTLSHSQLVLDIGQSFFLSAFDYGSSLTWESENAQIATISSTGSVNAISPGIVSIWAKGSSEKKKCVVTVVAISKGTAYPGDVNLYQGQTIELKIAGQRVSNWESDNTRIATVSSYGQVQGVMPGETNIWGYVNGVPKRFFVHVYKRP